MAYNVGEVVSEKNPLPMYSVLGSVSELLLQDRVTGALIVRRTVRTIDSSVVSFTNISGDPVTPILANLQTPVAQAISASSAPVNVALPAITGAAVVGSTLNVDNGSWSGTVTSYAYQWLKDGAVVNGATGSSYIIGGGDIGAKLSCVVSATGSQVVAATSLQTVAVIATPITLNTLTLSASAFTVGAAGGTLIGSIVGKTAGSLITLSNSNFNAVALSGGNLVTGSNAATAAGTFTITLLETYPGAIGNPKSTTFTITVNAAPVTSTPGGGTNNTSDHADVNNGYLTAAFAA